MVKVAIKRLDSVTKNDTTATSLINENFKELQKAIENTLSRDGSTPNFMDAELDMNSRRIINAADAVEDKDLVTFGQIKESISRTSVKAAEAAASASRAEVSAQSASISAQTALTASKSAEAFKEVAESVINDESFQEVSQDLAKGEQSEIKKLNANKANIDTVAGSIDNVNVVAGINTNVTAVADNKANIDTVAGSITDVQMVADIKEDVVKVSQISSEVMDVAGNETNINSVASNLPKIDTVSTNVADVNTVADSIADVGTVAGSIDTINTVVDNLGEIDKALTAVQDARTWATGEQSEVEKLEAGKLSSRGYADLSMAIANTAEDVPVDMSKLLAMNVIKGPKGDKGDTGVGIPAGGNTGQILTKVSSANYDMEWGEVASLPTAEGHAGEYLKTDGAGVEWAPIVIPESIAGTKTFTGGTGLLSYPIKLKNVNSASGNQYVASSLGFYDGADKNWGALRCDRYDGSRQTITALSALSSSGSSGGISAVCDESGENPVWFAQLSHRPADDADGLTVPSCEWVNKHLENKENISNKATTLDNASNDTYPTTLAVQNSIKSSSEGVYRPIDISTKIIPSFPFTAPSDGVWIGILQPQAQGAVRAVINGQASGYGFSNSDGYNQNKSSIAIPLYKGDILSWSGTIRTTFVSEFFTYR